MTGTHTWRLRRNLYGPVGNSKHKTPIFDVVCECGWQSKAYQTWTQAGVAADKHTAGIES